MAGDLEFLPAPPGRERPRHDAVLRVPYYGRWITIAAKTLINDGRITPDELSAKIDDVRARLEGKR